MEKPVIRELDDGCVVVDFGAKWFRCYPDGRVVTKFAERGKVTVRPSTSRERLLALGHAAFDEATA